MASSPPATPSLLSPDVNFSFFSPPPPSSIEGILVTSATPLMSPTMPQDDDSPDDDSPDDDSPIFTIPPPWPTKNGSTQVTPPPGPGNEGSPPGRMAAIVIGIVISAAIVLGIFVIFCKRRKRKLAAQNLPSYGPKSDHFASPHQQQNASPPRDSDKPFRPLSPGISLGSFKNTFTYEELNIATENFSDANLLGQGGFGYVHKGVLADGKVVAIKQLKAGSGQGEREFQAEIEIISRVHHRHLVSLVGYCIFGAQRLLVYEFVPNKTLEFHLHGKERPVMNWPTRMKIALGSARGLGYLHEDCHPKIIHRDIKAANILLDNSFEAKVADFGLAKYFLDTDTHVSTRVMGTFGYLAPEYATSGKLTEKSDVFSFGVLLVELITGFRPFYETNSFFDNGIVDWAKPLLAQALVDGKFDAIADSKLQEYDSGEMARMVACAAACIRHSAKVRPRMSQIVRGLEGSIPLDELNEGITPGHSTMYVSYGSSDYNSMQYREDMKNFKKIALESVDHGSSDFSGLTSDYGYNPSSSSTEDRQTTQEIEPQKSEKDTSKLLTNLFPFSG